LFFLQWTVARFDEGPAQVWQAFRADPLSAYAWAVVSFALGGVGRAQEATAYGKTAAEQDPPSFLVRWTLAFGYRCNGQYNEALALLETLWTEAPITWVALQLVPTSAKLGRLEEARVIYDQLLARRDHEYVTPFALAICASGLADHEAALTFSAAAVEGLDVLLGLFHLWIPDLDPLRADPRFARLVYRSLIGVSFATQATAPQTAFRCALFSGLRSQQCFGLGRDGCAAFRAT